MRVKSILLLVIALGCGLAVSIGVTQMVITRAAEVPAEAGEMQSIFVATRDIPAGEAVTVPMLRLERWPKEKVPEGALTQLELVEGRCPKTTIWEGAPLLATQLGDKEPPSTVKAQDTAKERPADSKETVQAESRPAERPPIPNGFRAAPVRLDPSISASHPIRAADSVDVLLHVQADPAKNIPTTLTRTILQDVKVYSVNGGSDATAQDKVDPSAAKTVWILVTPEQAESLTLAGELGQIRLVVRGPDDKEHKSLAGENLNTLLQQVGNSPAAGGPANGSAATAKATPGAGGKEELLSMVGAGQRPADSTSTATETSPENQTVSWTIRILAGTPVLGTALPPKVPAVRTATVPSTGTR